MTAVIRVTHWTTPAPHGSGPTHQPAPSTAAARTTHTTAVGIRLSADHRWRFFRFSAAKQRGYLFPICIPPDAIVASSGHATSLGRAMESYVVRIYRRNPSNPGEMVGVVEMVQGVQQTAFHDLASLWQILASAQGKARRRRRASRDHSIDANQPGCRNDPEGG